MANYLGGTYQNTPVESSINLPLNKMVLDAKQGTYNANKQALQQGLESLNALQVLRPQDKEYIQAKMTDLSTKINNYGNTDLSQSFVSDELFNMVKSAARDPFILSAVENTQKKKSYDAEVKELAKKSPDKVNDLNYSYGLEQGNFQAYMDGKANNIGSLSYTPYADIHKELKEFSENLDKYDESIEKVVPLEGTPYFVTTKGTRLTETDLKNKVNSLMSDGARKQMQVNGWGAYDQGKTEAEKIANVTTAFNSYSEGEIEKAENQLCQARLLLEKTPSNESYVQQVAQNEKYVADLKDGFNKMKADPAKNKSAMYTMAYEGNTVNSFASAFAFDNVTESYSYNKAYQDNIDNNYRVEKDNIDNAFKEKEFQAKYGENGTERVKSGTAGAAGGVQTKIDTDFAPEGETESFYDKQSQYVTGLENLTTGETNRIYEQLGDETKKNIDARVKASKGKMTRTDVLLEMGQDSSNIISAEDTKTLDKLNLQTTFEKQRFTQVVNKVKEEATTALDSKQTVKELVSNPDAKIMFTDVNGKERLFSARDVLLAHGVIDNKGNVVKNMGTGITNAIKKTALLSKLSDTNSLTPNDAIKYRKELAKLAGETYEQTTEPTLIEGKDSGYRHYKKGSKTGSLESTFASQGGSDILDVQSVRKYNQQISPDELRKKAGDLLAKDEKLAIGKVTVVSPKTEAFEKLADLVGTDFQVDKGNSISIKMIPNQPNMVKISQMQEGTKQGEITSNLRETTMRIQDLPESLLKQVDFHSTKKLITVANLPPISTPVSYGDINDRSRIKDVAETHFGGAQAIGLAEMTTAQGAKKVLYDNYKKQLGAVDTPTPTGTAINKLLKDKTIQVTFQKGRSKDVYPQVIKKVGNKTTVLWTSKTWLNDDNIESTYDVVRYTPQLMVNAYLDEILKANNTEAIKKLEILYNGQ